MKTVCVRRCDEEVFRRPLGKMIPLNQLGRLFAVMAAFVCMGMTAAVRFGLPVKMVRRQVA